jgi:glutaconate CoA-transferase subunit B
VKDVQENTGFELLVSPELEETPEPTDEELRVLREEVDPHRYIIGR